jgi:hypothetical protein
MAGIKGGHAALRIERPPLPVVTCKMIKLDKQLQPAHKAERQGSETIAPKDTIFGSETS